MRFFSETLTSEVCRDQYIAFSFDLNDIIAPPRLHLMNGGLHNKRRGESDR